MLLAIDPGPEKSGYIIMGDTLIADKGHIDNKALIEIVQGFHGLIAIEWIESYGMAVGKDVFETCMWVGRFVQAAEHAEIKRIGRKAIKLHLCNSARAKDSNVRQAIIDIYGGKDKAIGKKASPGPLYGVSGHAWSALAVAETVRSKK